MDIGALSLLVTLVALLILPIYSSYLMEWRIRKAVSELAEKYKLEDLIEFIKEIKEALT